MEWKSEAVLQIFYTIPLAHLFVGSFFGSGSVKGVEADSDSDSRRVVVTGGDDKYVYKVYIQRTTDRQGQRGIGK
jgi:hypothetical protein